VKRREGRSLPRKIAFLISEPYPVIGSPFDDPFFKAKSQKLAT
jgi:hypothetical protein